MRLLLINYEMDAESPVLAWQLRVAQELARRCELVVVLTEKQGRGDLPGNLKVVTVPRLLHRFPWRWLKFKWLMNLPVWQLCRRHRLDAVFLHMHHEWAYRLYPCWRLLGLPVMLWYAHGTVTWRLRLAHRCVTRVVASTPEGFRIPSAKLRIIGQGIDTRLFDLAGVRQPQRDILYVGRLSPRKRVHLLIEALDRLCRRHPRADLRLRLIGGTLTPQDRAYLEELRALAAARGVEKQVEFVGQVPMAAIPAYYRTAFLHVNVSRTGSMDKTVMESLACGCPVLTSNEAFFETLSQHPESIINAENPEAIAGQIWGFYQRRAAVDRASLRALVVGHHDLESYVDKLLANLQEIIDSQAK